jgi:glycosyltransferase involved in cell wall biosynthesis
MILEIIITTMNDNIHRALKLIQPVQENIIYQISHQITEAQKNVYISEIEEFLHSRSDVSYHYYFEKGLSLNRNRSMQLSRGELVLITDDDLIFQNKAIRSILQAFEELPAADILTFKTEFPDGKPFKRYAKHVHQHNFRSVMRVTSFEIAYRRKSIAKAGIKWDEQFGIGGKPFTNGIENIFLVDALRAGLKAYFIPETIVTHPFINSGYTYSDHLIKSKGAMFARMFGRWAYTLNFLFAVKKYRDYKATASFLRFLQIANQGTTSFLHLDKE